MSYNSACIELLRSLLFTLYIHSLCASRRAELDHGQRRWAVLYMRHSVLIRRHHRLHLPPPMPYSWPKVTILPVAVFDVGADRVDNVWMNTNNDDVLRLDVLHLDVLRLDVLHLAEWQGRMSLVLAVQKDCRNHNKSFPLDHRRHHCDSKMSNMSYSFLLKR